MKNADKPSFPVEVSVDENGNLRGSQTSNYSGFEMGLTKREHIAAIVLQGLLSNTAISGSHDTFAKAAVIKADALLKELES